MRAAAGPRLTAPAWLAVSGGVTLERGAGGPQAGSGASRRRFGNPLDELVRLCLENGAIECWILDGNKKTVSVNHRDGSVVLYGSGSRIPLTAFGGGELAVDEIFG